MVTWSTESPRSARSSSTSRYEREKRKYHPTASRMTSGSNCRHLNKPQTEEARRTIRPAYHGVTAKLQHFPQEALCCGCVLPGRKQEVDRRTAIVHRTI